MPRLDSGDRRTLLAAAGVLLLLVLLTLAVAPEGSDQTELPSTYSSGSKGAKAAWLLLQQSGYRVDRWEHPLRELPARPRATLVLAEPMGAPGGADTERLRAFVAEGGRVVATGLFAGAFLPGSAVVPRPWIVAWERVRALAPALPTRAAPAITLVAQAYWDSSSPATPLYGDGQHVVAVRYPYGKGEIVWWASATPLTNAGIKEPGNLDCLLACLGPPADGVILWDEFFHGYQPHTARAMARSPLTWFGAQAALLAVAVLVSFSRRAGPVLASPALTRLSPIEFVQTLGGLYQRAGAASVAVDICHERFRYWLARRLGAAASLPVTDLERLLRDRWRFEDAAFGETLRACEAARETPDLRPRDAVRLVQALFRYAAVLRVFRPPPRGR
jgi:hypothetical protein